MKRLPLFGVLLASVCIPAVLRGDDAPPKRTPKEALQAFNDLIGSWRGTGQPQQGTKEERDKNFWVESVAWEWQFKDKDAWLKVKFDKSKYFDGGELRYLPDRDRYQLTLRPLEKKDPLVFEGQLKDKRLTLERTDADKKETQRIIVSLLHANRYLFRYEVKTGEQTQFTALYQVGATKEGVPFADGDGKPECVVSGGLSTIPVKYKDKTYYVCCSGCRDAFKLDPETFIKEFEEKQAKKKQ
jgi:hypothetical protein